MFALCGAAFLAGFVDAVAGGGGLITLPSLLGTGLSVPLALGTNKGQAVFGAATSLITFYRKDGLDKPRIAPSFVAAFVGSLLGARLLLALPAAPLKPMVLVLLACALIAVLWPRPPERVQSAPVAERGQAAASAEPVSRAAASRTWLVALIALLLGSYDGFFGPGTGSMLIVIYMRVMGDSATRASGNAKVANFASNLAALLSFAYRGNVLWALALPMAAANACGAMLGARAALAVGPRLVRVVLVVVVVALMAKIGWELFGHSV